MHIYEIYIIIFPGIVLFETLNILQCACVSKSIVTPNDCSCQN